MFGPKDKYYSIDRTCLGGMSNPSLGRVQLVPDKTTAIACKESCTDDCKAVAFKATGQCYKYAAKDYLIAYHNNAKCGPSTVYIPRDEDKPLRNYIPDKTGIVLTNILRIDNGNLGQKDNCRRMCDSTLGCTAYSIAVNYDIPNEADKYACYLSRDQHNDGVSLTLPSGFVTMYLDTSSQ
jgi:hypothetical protein